MCKSFDWMLYVRQLVSITILYILQVLFLFMNEDFYQPNLVCKARKVEASA